MLVLNGFGHGADDLGDNCNNEIFKRVRDGDPRPSHYVCLLDLGHDIPCRGNGAHATVLLPHAAQKQTLSDTMDVLCLARLVPSLILVSGFITMFLIICIPKLNIVVFKHTTITLEWSIVFVEALFLFLGIESWKRAKRA